MKLSAIIVSYNVKFYLEQCIRSLLHAAIDIEMEILIVDNNSSDNTFTYIKKRFPNEWDKNLKFISNKLNLGFGIANNQALNEATGDYILYINPDTLIAEDCLTNCLSFFEQHPNAGGIGVRMLHPNGIFALESRRGIPTPFTSLCKITGLTRLFPKSHFFGRYYLQFLNDKEICPIDIVSGAFMMVPHKVLNEVGAFDENFFMYGEDIDLSYRIQSKGYQNYYLPTRILHYKGESTNKTSRKYVNTFYKAMVIFFNKHYSRTRFLLLPIYSAIYALALVTLIKQLTKHIIINIKQKTDDEIYYIFFGSTTMLNLGRLFCEKYMLKGTFIKWGKNIKKNTLDNIFINNNFHYFIVYDMNTFSVSEILNTFDTSYRNNCLIGTMYPKEKILITNQQVYNL